MPSAHWACRYESLALTNPQTHALCPLLCCSKCSWNNISPASPPPLYRHLTSRYLPRAMAFRVGSVPSRLCVSLLMACPLLQLSPKAKISPRRQTGGMEGGGGSSRGWPPGELARGHQVLAGGQRLRKGWPKHRSAWSPGWPVW